MVTVLLINYAACFSFLFFIWFTIASKASSKEASKDLLVDFTKKSARGT
jgi:hypothetical protein